jgi:hypothetical protein
MYNSLAIGFSFYVMNVKRIWHNRNAFYYPFDYNDYRLLAEYRLNTVVVYNVLTAGERSVQAFTYCTCAYTLCNVNPRKYNDIYYFYPFGGRAKFKKP